MISESLAAAVYTPTLEVGVRRQYAVDIGVMTI